jgi:hypothetical protein
MIVVTNPGSSSTRRSRPTAMCSACSSGLFLGVSSCSCPGACSAFDASGLSGVRVEWRRYGDAARPVRRGDHLVCVAF